MDNLKGGWVSETKQVFLRLHAKGVTEKIDTVITGRVEHSNDRGLALLELMESVPDESAEILAYALTYTGLLKPRDHAVSVGVWPTRKIPRTWRSPCPGPAMAAMIKIRAKLADTVAPPVLAMAKTIWSTLKQFERVERAYELAGILISDLVPYAYQLERLGPKQYCFESESEYQERLEAFRRSRLAATRLN
jgi:hypothetical protein